MQVRLARLEDLDTYFAFARVAQAWLHARGLGQYIPAAHDEYAGAMRTRTQAGTLYAVSEVDEVIGFFFLDEAPSQWWQGNETPALYLAGMVLAEQARGRGLGTQVLQWCQAETRRRKRTHLRLDCHADNAWLRRYYESHGFQLQRILEQHPGYIGCLYQCTP